MAGLLLMFVLLGLWLMAAALMDWDWCLGGIDLHDHRPVEGEIADVHVEERTVAHDELPFAFVHPRVAVLRPY